MFAAVERLAAGRAPFQQSKGVEFLEKKNKVEISRLLGMTLARRALEKGIKQVVFDRGGYIYHGRVKAFAEGAREGGLKF